MKKIQKGMQARKILIFTVILVFIFSILKVSMTLASSSSFNVTNAEIISKSSTTDVNSFSFAKSEIISDVTFHEVGDSITYKIKIKNNDNERYTIKSISNDNENDYIAYQYNNYEGTKINSKEEVTFELTQKYIQECMDMSDRNQSFSVNFYFTMEDENGNIVEEELPINEPQEEASEDILAKVVSVPLTGDNIGVYITTATISLIMLVILSQKRTVGKSNKKGYKHVVNSRAKKVSSSELKIKKIDYNSTENKNKNNGKHYGKGFKLFGLLIVLALILPPISKAATARAFVATLKSNIALKDKLLVSFSVDGTENNIIVNYNEKIDKIDNPEKEGYIFSGWKKEDGTKFDFDDAITDNINLIADFRPITYSILYELNGGEVTGNPTEYSMDNDDIILNKPKKEGYTFLGWTGTNLNGMVERVKISKGEKGDRTYTANWSPEQFSILYHLNGGEVTENPTEYNIETADFTLNNPTKDGYTFSGWSGTGLEGISQDVTISSGEKGDREYTANYTPTNYRIT